MLVAVEGIDGVGKSTLVERLAEEARGRGVSVRVVTFPQYHDTTFGSLITQYLNGRFGDVSMVSEYLSSLLFAAERYECRSRLRELIRTVDLVIIDRYVASNIAYNCAKVPRDQRHELARWVQNLEFDIFRIPKPTIQVLLKLETKRASGLLSGRKKKTYTDHMDAYESDSSYLAECSSVYEWLARQGAVGPWVTVDVSDERGRLRAKEHIAAEVWQRVTEALRPLAKDGSIAEDAALRLFDVHGNSGLPPPGDA